MLIDTHTHLYLDEFENGGCEAVRCAIDAGVGRMIFPNIDRASVEPMKRLHDLYPDVTYMAMGLHPTEIDGSPTDEQLRFVAEQLESDSRYVAVGEIGVDLYWDKTYREQQMIVFEQQMRWAAERSLPVIIHCREGLNEALEVIEGLDKVPAGVFHSFGGTCEDVERIRSYGDFHFGINGIVTFKNSKLREVLPAIGIDRVLLETDSPYLAPVPYRGRRNESAYLIHTAAYVASALGVTPDQLAEVTTTSASTLFGL